MNEYQIRFREVCLYQKQWIKIYQNDKMIKEFNADYIKIDDLQDICKYINNDRSEIFYKNIYFGKNNPNSYNCAIMLVNINIDKINELFYKLIEYNKAVENLYNCKDLDNIFNYIKKLNNLKFLGFKYSNENEENLHKYCHIENKTKAEINNYYKKIYYYKNEIDDKKDEIDIISNKYDKIIHDIKEKEKIILEERKNYILNFI